VSEPQPPAWWQPPPAQPPHPRAYDVLRPVYRERRPVRWWTVLLGLAGSVVWFALVAIASRGTPASMTSGLVVGAVVAGVAIWVLAWKGDVGLSVGISMVSGLTMGVIVFVAYVNALNAA
jgi:hypothetical protein